MNKLYLSTGNSSDPEENLTEEESNRLEMFLSTSTKLPRTTVTKIMQKSVRSDQMISESAIIATSNFAKLYIAELVETACQLFPDSQKLTPEQIQAAARVVPLPHM